MAEKQCNLIKNGGGMSKVKVIATSTATTFGAICSQLYSAFTSLSDNEKLHSRIVEHYPNTDYYLYPTDINTGKYFRTGSNGTTLELYGIDLSIPKCQYSTAPFTKITDITTQTTNIVYSLVVVD